MTVGSDKGSQVLRPQGDGPPKTTVDALSSTQSSLWSSEEKGDGQEAFDNSDLGGAGTAGMLCCRYGLLVSTMSLLMVAVGYGAPAVVRAYALSCTDPGCLEPNAALERSMADAQGNPCDDFYGFVCGGWQRENPGVASHFQSLQQRVATAAIMSLVLDEGGDGLPSHQVARLFQRCAQVAFNEQNRIDELRAFLDRFNLSWPTPMSR
ncbi:membrane metallo-endopeptidase-like 1 [Dermacentor silvarum]|uniref:membrane metallo-endopeptidase-like 1 n=1 Tax=Dermacentor silvarum TaxID=543639 RepID=UPI0021013DF0|nr:membrane metallo-endopeptidase-like 1 [Dermacentor silvarum]